jgi:hypothetical protein
MWKVLKFDEIRRGSIERSYEVSGVVCKTLSNSELGFVSK